LAIKIASPISASETTASAHVPAQYANAGGTSDKGAHCAEQIKLPANISDQYDLPPKFDPNLS
jgi:hypothetical protein